LALEINHDYVKLMSVVIIPTYLFFSKKWERKRKKSDSNMFLFVFGKGMLGSLN